MKTPPEIRTNHQCPYEACSPSPFCLICNCTIHRSEDCLLAPLICWCCSNWCTFLAFTWRSGTGLRCTFGWQSFCSQVPTTAVTEWSDVVHNSSIYSKSVRNLQKLHLEIIAGNQLCVQAECWCTSPECPFTASFLAAGCDNACAQQDVLEDACQFNRLPHLILFLVSRSDVEERDC